MTNLLPLPDASERRLAAGDLEHNLVVLAGAGTGKTTPLIDRLTLLIIGKEIPVEKIVALTFTKKAAEEMRERLEKRLRHIIDVCRAPGGGDASLSESKIDPLHLLKERYSANQLKWGALAQTALDDIPKSQIGTIHSFAGHLLRLYPLQAGVDPKFREGQGMMAENVFDVMWNEWIASELSEKNTDPQSWMNLLGQIRLSDIKELARLLVSPMVDIAALKITCNLTPLAQEALAQLEALRAQYPLPKRAPSFLPGLEALGAIFILAAKGQAVPESLLDLIGSVDKPPKDWLEAKAALSSIKKTAEALAMVDDKLIQSVLTHALPLVEKVRSELGRVGAVSFDGLLVFARNLLRDHAAVRTSLKKRFAAFLVDEFQDTDPLQGEILFYLAEQPGSNALRWQEVELEPGRLFVVGDPKQSIYRFRGADIAAFEAFEDHMVRQGAKQATLSANFRSDPLILDYVNAIFPKHMIEKKYFQPAYVPLQTGLSASSQSSDHAGPAVRIVHVSALEDARLKSKDRRRVEANAIATWIQSEFEKGLKYSDVALLLRSANAFELYLEAFRERGIPYLAEGEKSFYRTSEAMDFLNLLSVVANPDDQLALVGVLRSSLGGLTDREIWELKQTESLDPRRTPRVHKDKVGRLFLTLSELSVEAQAQPLGDSIRSILRRTWSLEMASTSSHGEQAVANVLKVGRLADTWSEQAPLTLQSFVERFERYREQERDEGENPLADVKYDAVKILTIHKAKGLEFPVVILPNLSAKKNNGGDKKSILRDWRTGLVGLRLETKGSTNAAMVEIERQEEKRESAEEIRVFYVAATRAKSKLICFVDGSGRDAGRFSDILKTAPPVPGVSTENIQGDPMDPSQRYQSPLILPQNWNVDSLAESFHQRTEELIGMQGFRLLSSPTSLLAEPDKRPVVDDESAPSRDQAILLGHICHKVLEEWDYSCPATKRPVRLETLLQRAARLYEVRPSDPVAGQLLAEAETILTGFLASDVAKKIARSTILGRELPFLYPLPAGGADGTIRAMRGFIDLLYEQDGRLVIADYKSNKLDASGPQKLLEHYRPQGEAYQEAMRQSLGREAEFELIFLRESLSVRIQSLYQD